LYTYFSSHLAPGRIGAPGASGAPGFRGAPGDAVCFR